MTTRPRSFHVIRVLCVEHQRNTEIYSMNVHREQKPETHSVSVRIWPDNGFLSLLKRLRGALVSEEF